MRRGLVGLVSALAVVSPPALALAAPLHASAQPLVSCTVSSAEDFSPGVQTASLAQSVSGGLSRPGLSTGPGCTGAPDGIVDAQATLIGSGKATCLADPALTTLDLTGTMAISWNKADGDTAGTSRVSWAAHQVDMGSVVFAGTVTSGLFRGAAVTVAGLSANAVTSVTGGCAAGSPLTGVRTTDTYLRLTQA
ncbi:hypothetical protein DN069_26225 [Streptacidiphilus pinicola]|uniref:Ig-like domain-containing protein n=1 Tax=Streptacidiphilus pinicola TaxID=2219663 RepID=A0A2X0IGT6_9ACTN|nr:hypothetical protein [Streptacidiphilus pinicola]RAG82621.1 hypothetical protein DN069_26225 [Streptacidiphilus pinicola]